jgi:hypothetical protein
MTGEKKVTIIQVTSFLPYTCFLFKSILVYIFFLSSITDKTFTFTMINMTGDLQETGTAYLSWVPGFTPALVESMLVIFLVFCVVFIGRVSVGHLFSFLCCVFGRVCVGHCLSFLCCIFGRVNVGRLTTYLLCLVDVFFNRQSAYLWVQIVPLFSPTCSFIRMRQTSYRGFSRKKNRS